MKNDKKTVKRKVTAPSMKEGIFIRIPTEFLVEADRLAHGLSRGALRELDRNDVLRAAMAEGLKLLATQAATREKELNNAGV